MICWGYIPLYKQPSVCLIQVEITSSWLQDWVEGQIRTKIKLHVNKYLQGQNNMCLSQHWPLCILILYCFILCLCVNSYINTGQGGACYYCTLVGNCRCHLAL